MEEGTTSTTLTARLPILNPGEYDLWLMRIEQYFLMTDYSLWEDRRNKMKAKGTLLMALPNKNQLKFHSYKDAKLLMEAIEKRLQKLISQLKIQGEVITQEDMNLKLLRSLPSEWKTHALIWRNKEKIETISLDDLYNNLKIYEPELTGSTNTSQNSQNMAFVSSNSTNSNSNNSTNEADNTTYRISVAHTQSNPTSGDNLSDVVIYAFLATRRFIKRTGKKLDVNGQRVGFDRSKVECYNCHKNDHFARECRAPRNQENRGRENSKRTVTVETPTKNALVAQDGIGGSNFEVDSCSKSCVKACATLKEQYDSLSSDYKKSQFNLVSYKAGYNAASSTAASPAVESFVNSSEMLENQEYNKSKFDKGYHAVPPPYTGNFIPSKPYLTFMDEIVKSENVDVITIVTPSNVKKVESNHKSTDVKNNRDAVKLKTVRKNNFKPPIIEDWNSDDDSEVEFIPNVKDKTVRPSTKKIKFIKSTRETVEKVATPKQNKHYPRGNQRNWNNLMSQRLGSDFKMINKACFVCGSFEHLHYLCDKKVIKPVWNNSRRVNHKYFANKMTHPHPNRRFVPQAVLTRSGKINTAGASVNTAVRPVNTAGSKTTVNTVRVKDTTARDRAVVSENKGKGANAVKASACWGNPQQKEYKEKGVIDSGCSRHMTGNKCYLTEYEDYDGGFVSFGDGKGRISRKGKIKTGTLDFDNVYFCKELKYNLFSVSQICDKKNNVLFTDTEYLVLSSEFKLLDESQVLLRVLRKDNIYSVDLKSVVPTKVVTYDFSRFSWVFFFATKDETSGILKTFITEIENQLDYKVKVIRSDNRTEFKNSVMNQFYKMKGIKREFSVARTPQQNGVAEKRNRTLIEAARTMVLVIKPHTKTSYELIRRRTPLINFMKPFGCPVTILNTRDHLGKFNGKADEGFFVGYYVVSKAMRVFNKRTTIVEETLNIRFLKNAPNVTRN
ncbi:ribonuclease H-like domain-containing protein [Tanacetum coccineum]|uniref:Ribonuclease H-like domain-containing protein n=1 Tax=Tanacetum coccineum TaxID=301880 RepID=A0ABQ4XNB3_9ASTR